MPRIVRCSIIQASIATPTTEPLAAQKKAMIEKHVGLIRKLPRRARRLFACRRFLTARIFAPSNPSNGMRPPSLFPMARPSH